MPSGKPERIDAVSRTSKIQFGLPIPGAATTLNAVYWHQTHPPMSKTFQ
jgi:hypothetical protein